MTFLIVTAATVSVFAFGVLTGIWLALDTDRERRSYDKLWYPTPFGEREVQRALGGQVDAWNPPPIYVETPDGSARPFDWERD